MKNNLNLNGFLKINRVNLPYIYGFFALISIFIYFNALHNDFLYDDKFFIEQNLYIRSPRFLPEIFTSDAFHFAPSGSDYYRPIQILGYSLDYFFWKLNPLGYHLTNIFIHSLNSFLVFALVYLLFKNKFLALLSGIFFCVHPIHIGVVTVIGGRSNILEMMFMFLALLSLGHYYAYKNSRTYFLSLFLFVLAILSREGALLLPLFIILCGAILNVDKKKLLLSLLPFLLICGFYLLFRARFMPSDKLKLQEMFSWQKWSAFFYLAQSYISQLILPSGLAIKILSKESLLNLILIPLSFAYLLVTVILIIARHKVVLFGFVFYLLGLLPVLNLVGHISFLGKILSEPYVYMASVGFFIIIAYILIKLFTRFPKIASAVIVLIILSYGSFTVINNINYKNEAKFYNYMLKVDPGNTIAHLNLGNIYLKKNMFDEAEKEARIVLGREPDAWDAYLLLGNVSKEKGDLAKAEELYNRTLILKPGSFEAMNNLGLIYKMQGADEKAIDIFKRAIAINPELVTTMHSLTDILIGKKLYNEALVLCDKILKLNPQDINAHVKIGIILAESGRLQQAELVFREALKLDPNSVEALRNLGVLYANSGDLNRAISLWKRALVIKPDDEEAKKNIERAETIKESQRH